MNTLGLNSMSTDKKTKKMTDDQNREIMDALAITMEILTEPGQLTDDRLRDAAAAIRLIYHFFENEFTGGK